MKRNFTNENFEQFLRQSADGLRMRPRQRTWKGISKELNRTRRRVALLSAFLVLLSGSIGYSILNAPHSPLHPGTDIYSTKDQHFAIAAKPTSNGQPLALESGVPVSRIMHNANTISLPATHRALSNISNDEVAENINTLTPVPQPFTSTIVDSYPNNENGNENTTRTNQHFDFTLAENAYPLSIESVINSYKNTPRKKTIVQLYFTPTVSYRKLQEHKKVINSSVPVGIASYQAIGASMYNINNAVTQKPDIGLELGMAVKHTIAKNLKLRGGLQFNINRYDVRVFNAGTQLSTIQLNNANSSPDYLNTLTNYSNITGHHSDWLQNLYYQISAPVGLELKLRGDENIHFGIASTVQPTYILGERAYLISSDYKSYAEVPGLLRKYNVNTSLETFVSYSTGRYTWQVGPQVRYQILSSFVKSYSVKEHLMDFGLKIGISPNK